MNRNISAVFDSTDSAELALMKLRREGVAFKVKGMEKTHRNAQWQNTLGALPTSRPYNMVSDQSQYAISDPPGTAGVWYTTENVAAMSVGGGSDMVSEEVRVTLTIDDSMRTSAERVIIGCHGRKIKSSVE